MIDITTNTAKQRALVYIDRQMTIIENIFIVSILRGLTTQFNASARLVDRGSLDINQAVNDTGQLTYDALLINYKRIASVFGKIILDSLKTAGFEQRNAAIYETKTFQDEYQAVINRWINFEAGKKITKILRTTKEVIRKIIGKSFSDGLSNVETAKAIRKTGREINRNRALKIVRTETHTVAMKSMSEAMQTTRLIYTKTWVTAGDSRVRSAVFNHVAANGETVGKDEYYTNTGEALFYPGDSRGSAGNIINCRCIEIFNTAEKILRSAKWR